MKKLITLAISILKDFSYLRTVIEILKERLKDPVSYVWMDGKQVMEMLKVGKRGMQSLRDKGLLPYSIVGGKFYYKTADLLKLLESNYNPGKHSRENLRKKV